MPTDYLGKWSVAQSLMTSLSCTAAIIHHVLTPTLTTCSLEHTPTICETETKKEEQPRALITHKPY